MAQYASRRHQVQSFARQVKSGKLSLAVALQYACEVGAAEARSQALTIIGDSQVRNKICETSIRELLGWPLDKANP